MTLVVLGIDALDPEPVSPKEHPYLTLAAHKSVATISSSAGEPSTHDLWPTIITGPPPAEHGLELDDGVAWDNPLLRAGSSVADAVLPDGLQTRVGAWLLNNAEEVAFRMLASYYVEQKLSTLLDGESRRAIGVPNYIVEKTTDREHQLRQEMGELFECDPEARGGHESADPLTFYEQCMEMAMVRPAGVRRALRSRRHELVFGYTSGVDLIGHVSHDRPELQQRAYDELNEVVAGLRDDLRAEDELVLVSDHGLQGGLHTDEAMIAATDPGVVEAIGSVLGVRAMIDELLDRGEHSPGRQGNGERGSSRRLSASNSNVTSPRSPSETKSSSSAGLTTRRCPPN